MNRRERERGGEKEKIDREEAFRARKAERKREGGEKEFEKKRAQETKLVRVTKRKKQID